MESFCFQIQGTLAMAALTVAMGYKLQYSLSSSNTIALLITCETMPCLAMLLGAVSILYFSDAH